MVKSTVSPVKMTVSNLFWNWLSHLSHNQNFAQRVMDAPDLQRSIRQISEVSPIDSIQSKKLKNEAFAKYVYFDWNNNCGSELPRIV
jgi:hypothetical protein